MPYVEIHMVEGRTQEQREKLAKAITDLITKTLDVTKDNVWIET